jgi:hypothetical protein
MDDENAELLRRRESQRDSKRRQDARKKAAREGVGEQRSSYGTRSIKLLLWKVPRYGKLMRPKPLYEPRLASIAFHNVALSIRAKCGAPHFVQLLLRPHHAQSAVAFSEELA